VVYVSNQVYGNLRPDGTTRGKWRIPDGNVEGGLFSCLKLRRW
jgi:hypothetical protein